MTKHIANDFLGIKIVFSDSREYETSGVKHDRMMSLLESIGAKVYESGPAAKDYIIVDDYQKRNIQLRWKSYEGYPEYDQKSDVFNHNISIIDLLCNVGEKAPYYIWGWRKEKGVKSWVEV